MEAYFSKSGILNGCIDSKEKNLQFSLHLSDVIRERGLFQKALQW